MHSPSIRSNRRHHKSGRAARQTDGLCDKLYNEAKMLEHELKKTERKMVFTCTFCQESFTVPWYEDYPIPEEMFAVINHEEAHTANGEKPGWELKVIEGGENG